MVQTRQSKLIMLLVIIILILVAVVLYSFVVQPSINSYVIRKQIDAQNIVLQTLLLQIQQQGFTQITDAEGNSIVLVPLPQSQDTTANTNTTSNGISGQ